MLEALIVSHRLFPIKQWLPMTGLYSADISTAKGMELSFVRIGLRSALLTALSTLSPLITSYSHDHALLFRTVDCAAVTLAGFLTFTTALLFFEFSRRRMPYLLALRKLQKGSFAGLLSFAEMDLQSIMTSGSCSQSLYHVATQAVLLAMICVECIGAVLFANQVGCIAWYQGESIEQRTYIAVSAQYAQGPRSLPLFRLTESCGCVLVFVFW